jgi:hypothetical protein
MKEEEKKGLGEQTLPWGVGLRSIYMERRSWPQCAVRAHPNGPLTIEKGRIEKASARTHSQDFVIHNDNSYQSIWPEESPQHLTIQIKYLFEKSTKERWIWREGSSSICLSRGPHILYIVSIVPMNTLQPVTTLRFIFDSKYKSQYVCLPPTSKPIINAKRERTATSFPCILTVLRIWNK